jgi:hypothetical protein
MEFQPVLSAGQNSRIMLTGSLLEHLGSSATLMRPLSTTKSVCP